MSFPEGIPEERGQLGLAKPALRQPGHGLRAGPEDGPLDRDIDGDGLPDIPEAAPGRERQGKVSAAKPSKTVKTSSRNVHGLSSKSELLYPEAYRPVDPVFWAGLSQSQQNEVERLQAVAQEKVGYERGTQKYFIEDFDPRTSPRGTTDVNLVAIATPRLVLGGAMIGSGLTCAVLWLTGVAADPAFLIVSLCAAVGGGLSIAFGRN